MQSPRELQGPGRHRPNAGLSQNHGVNVNALAPGFFPSKMSEKLIERLTERLLPTIPLHRFGGPEDLKGPALLLCSEAGRHITGQCLAVDGGATA